MCAWWVRWTRPVIEYTGSSTWQKITLQPSPGKWLFLDISPIYCLILILTDIKKGQALKNQLSDKPIQATYNYLVPIVKYTIRSTKS